MKYINGFFIALFLMQLSACSLNQNYCMPVYKNQSLNYTSVNKHKKYILTQLIYNKDRKKNHPKQIKGKEQFLSVSGHTAVLLNSVSTSTSGRESINLIGGKNGGTANPTEGNPGEG